MGDWADFAFTAYHEAGHVVASAMRGSGEPHPVTPEHTAAGRFTDPQSKRLEWGFIAYAGPWAQARAGWEEAQAQAPSSHHDMDDEGVTFAEYVLSAFTAGCQDDLDALKSADLHLHGDGPPDVTLTRMSLPGREREWSRELEAVWPAIRAVAGRLLAGESVSLGDVRLALAEVRAAE